MFRTALTAIFIFFFTNNAFPQQLFSETVGKVEVKPVRESDTIKLPIITWGGDVGVLQANGGLKTAENSIYDKSHLKFEIFNGDNFPDQVKKYLSGETPFIRGTTSMLCLAAEVLGQDHNTKPVVILQLSWSAGDHLVGREAIRTLNDLKGKKIAVQKGGPHVGLIDDVLRTAKLTWNDVEIVWTNDLTGDNGPAAVFRKDPSVDACTVITPDMIGLTSGLEEKGSGEEGTVSGAHVVVSTASMSRSIADVYAVRSDWYQKNKEKVDKFVAGYLTACEKIVTLRRGFEENKVLNNEYRDILQMAQNTFGKEVLPSLDVDAHVLLLDCSFVGLPGNISFFEDKGNLSNFENKMKAGLDLAIGQGYAQKRIEMVSGHLDYQNIASVAGLEYTKPVAERKKIMAESVELYPDTDLDDRTIVSFSINFEPNQESFDVVSYGEDFERVVSNASTFGNAAIAIRGHSDPGKTLVDLIKVGMTKGVIKRSGQKGSYQYFFNGKPLDLQQTKGVMELIEKGYFDGEVRDSGNLVLDNPRETALVALNLSLARADAVKNAIISFAKSKNINLDVSQMQPVGVGILEPLVAKPSNIDESKQNMRVEFRIIRVNAEALNQGDYDY